ncbi:MAG: lysophospholipase [Spirochaetes bacterium]|nr:lysophospholipase [Spirochaetota bacterium]
MKSYAHTTGTFIGKGGVEIFFQSWTVPSPRGILVIAHGVGEHSGRYANIIERLAGAGISVYANDHRGHGRSGGKRGHVDSFMEYVYDLKLLVDFVKEEHAKIPMVLMGHSMGGTIAFKYALTYPEDMKGLVLSSAGLITAVEVPGWKTSMGRFFSKYLPGLSMATGLDASQLSHDRDVVEAYENDPLVHGKVSARWYTEFTSTGEECLRRASELRMPLLVFHGKGDLIVDYRGSLQTHDGASSADKTLYVFENLYHETMNEAQQERQRVLDIVSKWILKAVAARGKATVKGAAGKAAGTKKAAVKKAAAAKKAEKKPAAKKSAPVKAKGRPKAVQGKKKKR